MAALALDPYVIDTLMPDLVGHDRKPSAFLVWLYLWRQSTIRKSSSVPASLAMIAENTGLSRRAVQNAVAVLTRRKLILARRESATAIPVYVPQFPWRRGRPT
jgi:DNA-binding transcriptional ArsR family regulator